MHRTCQNSEGVESSERLANRPTTHAQSMRQIRLYEALSGHITPRENARGDVLDNLVGRGKLCVTAVQEPRRFRRSSRCLARRNLSYCRQLYSPVAVAMTCSG
jgi:hypothetical protein